MLAISKSVLEGALRLFLHRIYPPTPQGIKSLWEMIWMLRLDRTQRDCRAFDSFDQFLSFLIYSHASSSSSLSLLLSFLFWTSLSLPLHSYSFLNLYRGSLPLQTVSFSLIVPFLPWIISCSLPSQLLFAFPSRTRLIHLTFTTKNIFTHKKITPPFNFYTHTHTHTHTRAHTHGHANAPTHPHARTHTHTHTHIKDVARTLEHTHLNKE